MIQGKLIVGRCIDLMTPVQTNNGAAAAGFQRLNSCLLHINESTRAYGLFGTKTSTTGAGHVAKAHRNYQWLEWRPGFVSEVAQNHFDVLTGPMSGCWITRYMRGGVQCVGHVGTEHSAASPNSVAAKAAWNGFRAGAVGAVTGFNPFNDWVAPYPAMNHGKDGAPKVFGLVTNTGQFYSVFTYPLLAAPTTIRIAGIQQVANTLPNPVV